MNKKINKDTLFNVYQSLINKFACFNQYGWKGDFIQSESKKYFKELKEWIGNIDLNKLSSEEAKLLGFKKWDSSGLMLIPLYLTDCIKDGSVVHCIDGEQCVWGVDEIDKDERFGCIAYGFYPSSVKKINKKEKAI